MGPPPGGVAERHKAAAVAVTAGRRRGRRQRQPIRYVLVVPAVDGWCSETSYARFCRGCAFAQARVTATRLAWRMLYGVYVDTQARSNGSSLSDDNSSGFSGTTEASLASDSVSHGLPAGIVAPADDSLVHKGVHLGQISQSMIYR